MDRKVKVSKPKDASDFRGANAAGLRFKNKESVREFFKDKYQEDIDRLWHYFREGTFRVYVGRVRIGIRLLEQYSGRKDTKM